MKKVSTKVEEGADVDGMVLGESASTAVAKERAEFEQELTELEQELTESMNDIIEFEQKVIELLQELDEFMKDVAAVEEEDNGAPLAPTTDNIVTEEAEI